MDIIQILKRIPRVAKIALNLYAPFRGAGIQVEVYQPAEGYIRVKMPLTSKNRNIVGVHFGGSLYAMVDPFYMLILIQKLGKEYIVWDKAAQIHFLSPGRDTVYVDIRISEDEIQMIKKISANNEALLRSYTLNIVDENGQRIAEVEKTLYIRRKKSKATRFSFKSKTKDEKSA